MELPIGTDFPKTADLVIVGGGILGVASAFFVQRAGLSCVVLEKRPLLCTLTTPVSTGAFRAQFDNAEEIKLVLESIRFFIRFKEVTGFRRMPLVVEEDVLPDPAQVGLPGPKAAVLSASRSDELPQICRPAVVSASGS